MAIATVFRVFLPTYMGFGSGLTSYTLMPFGVVTSWWTVIQVGLLAATGMFVLWRYLEWRYRPFD
ncbi:MAG: hypothetical protein OJJ21_22230 [Ferrovibrio sp.]|uniref:hypothetical protein n=1 Tax=Ferrovibrio sp. TaxID=1917215 RepID=UPI00260C4A5A|nr:hypothetical protein [Ferrovibrio sp.]MCW0236332.1 hypothetical protein [Ferrovibrio sp.]